MHPLVKPVVFTLCLAPFAWLAYAAGSGGLGPDPAEAIMRTSGEWGLRLLALTLLMSPLRRWAKRPWPLRLRRMLGLYTFFYATIHLAAFGHFYVGWTLPLFWGELAERPYITVGMLAWVLMLPLAVTSFKALQRRMGRNWVRLHTLVYPAAVLASIHLLWQVRSDVTEAAVYCAIFALLLCWRMPVFKRSQIFSKNRLPRQKPSV